MENPATPLNRTTGQQLKIISLYLFDLSDFYTNAITQSREHQKNN